MGDVVLTRRSGGSCIDLAHDSRQCENTMNRRRVLLALLAGLFFLTGLLAISLRQQSPFERYISPPLDAKGIRLEFLIPRGWTRPEFEPKDFANVDFVFLSR